MKHHLTNILYEEYKLIILLNALEKLGVSMDNVMIDNLSIVIDIIGFPKDNGLEYKDDLDNPECFCRDWLTDRFFEIIHNSQVQIMVGEDGLSFKDYDEKEIKIKLAEYIGWLYQEYESL